MKVRGEVEEGPQEGSPIPGDGGSRAKVRVLTEGVLGAQRDGQVELEGGLVESLHERACLAGHERVDVKPLLLEDRHDASSRSGRRGSAVVEIGLGLVDAGDQSPGRGHGFTGRALQTPDDGGLSSQM